MSEAEQDFLSLLESEMQEVPNEKPFSDLLLEIENEIQMEMRVQTGSEQLPGAPTKRDYHLYIYMPGAGMCEFTHGDYWLMYKTMKHLYNNGYYHQIITDSEMVVHETGSFIINRICRGQAHIDNNLYLKRDYHWFSIYWNASLTPGYDMQDNEANAYAVFTPIAGDKILVSKGRVIEPTSAYDAPTTLLQRYFMGWFTQ